MFVDEVKVEIKAGDGGNGSIAFRREKYVPHGGPAGGDGGAGGSVILESDSNLSTLLDFRYQHKYEAPRGGHGASKQMHGPDATDLVLRVPVGTSATDADTGQILADLTKHGQKAIIASGGRGGRGNMHFGSSTQQAPKFSENGEPGEHRFVKLELKLLADVGIIGFPNAGKSTLIAAMSAARPKIADYPFTTLVPNLGLVRVDEEKNFVAADIPGLIEGASEGIGLGHQFLRHIERTRLLVHMIDASGITGRDPLEDFDIINRELAAYSDRLAALPQIVVLNKSDVADPEEIDLIRDTLGERIQGLLTISAATGHGVRDLVYIIAQRLENLPSEPLISEEEIVRITANGAGRRRFDKRWTIEYDPSEQLFTIKGTGIERFVAMTNMTNEEGVKRLQKTMEKIGVVAKLKSLGAKEGDSVKIGESEFSYIDEDAEDDAGVSDHDEEEFG